jgi:hypothetical protein
MAMNEKDLKEILLSIDVALDVYRKNEGKLNAFEIGMKSMLTTMRFRIVDQLLQDRASSGFR